MSIYPLGVKLWILLVRLLCLLAAKLGWKCFKIDWVADRERPIILMMDVSTKGQAGIQDLK